MTKKEWFWVYSTLGILTGAAIEYNNFYFYYPLGIGFVAMIGIFILGFLMEKECCK